MILLNKEQRLGRKAYILLSLRQLVPPVIILLIALALLALSGPATTFSLWVAKTAGIKSLTISASISTVVNDVVIFAFLLGLVALFMSFITARVEYRNYTFTFEEFDLHLKRGLWRTAEVSIPYRQMQDVNIERGVLHQFTGTSRLVINSAGHQEAEANETDIVLDPIDKDLAQEIRLMLQRKIGVQVVEGENEADREAAAESTPTPSV